MNRKVAAALAVIALAGEWVTTPDGRRVCRLAQTLEHGMMMPVSFCMSWQDGFSAPAYAQSLPFRDGYLRTNRHPGAAWGTLQIHVEGRGWVP